MIIYLNVTNHGYKDLNAYWKVARRLKQRGISYSVDNNGYIKIDTGSNKPEPNERGGIHWIDMKPFFALSSKAHNKANGNGWYMRVPIKPTPKTTDMLSLNDKQKINNLQPGQTINLKELEPLLDENVTGGISQSNSNGISTPIMFRTVSDKSDANSWITIDRTDKKDSGRAGQDIIHSIHLNLDVSDPQDQTITNTLMNTPQVKANITNQIKADLNKQSFNVGNDVRSLPYSYQENLLNPNHVPFNNTNNINR